MKKAFVVLGLIIIVFACKKENSTQHLSDHPILTPELFLPGIVSSQHIEFGMTISPDAKTIFFTRRIGDEKQKIYETNYTNGTWSDPQIAQS